MFFTITSMALGSSFVGDKLPESNLDSPFGKLSPRNARGLCTNKHVFIGTITKAVPRKLKYQSTTTLYTDIKLSIERDIRENLGSTISMTVQGGLVDGKLQGIPKAQPYPVVGERYLIASTPTGAPFGPWPAGQQIFGATIWVSPALPLPAVEEIQDEWEDFCDAR